MYGVLKRLIEVCRDFLSVYRIFFKGQKSKDKDRPLKVWVYIKIKYFFLGEDALFNQQKKPLSVFGGKHLGE